MPCALLNAVPHALQELQEVIDRLQERDDALASLQRRIQRLQMERDAAAAQADAVTVRSEEQDAENTQRVRALEAQYADLQAERATLQEVRLCAWVAIVVLKYNTHNRGLCQR